MARARSAGSGPPSSLAWRFPGEKPIRRCSCWRAAEKPTRPGTPLTWISTRSIWPPVTPSTARLASRPGRAIGTGAGSGSDDLARLVFRSCFGGALGEEAGWRGYGLPRLADSFFPLVAELIIALVCGLWRLPLMLTGHTKSTYLRPGADPVPVHLSLYLDSQPHPRQPARLPRIRRRADHSLALSRQDRRRHRHPHCIFPGSHPYRSHVEKNQMIYCSRLRREQ